MEVSGTFSVPSMTERRIVIGGYNTAWDMKELNIEQYASGGKLRLYINRGEINSYSDLLPANALISFSYSYNPKTGKHTYSANGENKTIQYQISGKSELTEKLFNDNRGYTGWGTGLKIYGITIKNGRTYMDFVPVLDPNGEPAMLDKINQVLYYNAGRGSFTTDKGP